MFLNKLKAIIEGHFTVFKHSFKKRITQEYPEVKQDLPENFRGVPDWYAEKCIACKICEKVCPANAVRIEKGVDNVKFGLNLSKCIICGNCAYNCPKNAIIMSKKYETAVASKSLLIIEKNSKDNNYE